MSPRIFLYSSRFRERLGALSLTATEARADDETELELSGTSRSILMSKL